MLVYLNSYWGKVPCRRSFQVRFRQKPPAAQGNRDTPQAGVVYDL